MNPQCFADGNAHRGLRVVVENVWLDIVMCYLVSL